MSDARDLPRHVRSTGRPPRQLFRRAARVAVAAVAAALVTGSVVAVEVEAGSAPSAPTTAAAGSALSAASSGSTPPTAAPRPMTARLRAQDAPDLQRDTRPLSRSAQRVTLRAKPKVRDIEFRTAPLNLWPAPREKGRPLAVLPEGGTVKVTGAPKDGFAPILLGGRVRWVNAGFLAEHRPPPPAPPTDGTSPSSTSPSSTSPSSTSSTAGAGGVTTAPCPDGSGTESGLTSGAVRLFRSVCNAFPALSSYGGYDAHGEHASGRAIDFMVSDSGLGQAVADWARAHAAELDLYDVIWAQHIWTPVRASEGWRAMPDRGSATANHFDHVHISVN